MIEAYFGLLRRPFLAVPDIHSYFPSEAMELARTNTLRCLDRGEGISLIFGSSGVGKSLLLRLLGLPFQFDYPVAMISNHRLKSPKALLQQVLFELQQPFCGSDENELRLLLWDHLRRASFPGVILLIDEGQTLSLSVLEEIRMMLNCDNGSAPKFRIAIAATPEFEERLTHPKLKAFNQWIVSRSYLEPLTRCETAEYVHWQSQNAKNSTLEENENFNKLRQSAREFDSGRKKNTSSRVVRVDSAHHRDETQILFDGAACDKIYQYTQGVPRLINQLCDHALVLSCENESEKIVTEVAVRAAWSNLQQVPGEETPSFYPEPATVPVCDTAPDPVVEFGTLDEEEIVTKNEELEEENDDDFDDTTSENTFPETQAAEISDAEFSEHEPEPEYETINCESVEEDIPWSGPVTPISPQPWTWDEIENEISDNGQVDECNFRAETCETAPEPVKAVPMKNESEMIEKSNSEKKTENSPNSVTKTSGYVYQTKTYYESAYPNGPEAAMTNWTGPGHQIQAGPGTSYREVLFSETVKLVEQSQNSTAVSDFVLPLGMEISETKKGDPRISLPGFLEVSNASPCDLLAATGFEEIFHEESEITDENLCDGFAPIAQPVEYSIPDSFTDENENENSQSQPELVRNEELAILRLHLDTHRDHPTGERNVLREAFEQEIPIPKTKIALPESFEFGSHSARILVKPPHSLFPDNPVDNENDKEDLELFRQTLMQKIEPDSARRIAALLSDTLAQEENDTDTIAPEPEADEKMTIRFDSHSVKQGFVPATRFPRTSKKAINKADAPENGDAERSAILPMNTSQKKNAPQRKGPPVNAAVNADFRSKGSRPPLKLRRPTEEGADPFEDATEDAISSVPIAEKRALDLGSLFSQAYR